MPNAAPTQPRSAKVRDDLNHIGVGNAIPPRSVLMRQNARKRAEIAPRRGHVFRAFYDVARLPAALAVITRRQPRRRGAEGKETQVN